MRRGAARARSGTRSLVCGAVRRITFLAPPVGPALTQALRSPFAGAPEPALPAGAPAAAVAEPAGTSLAAIEPVGGLPTIPLGASWGTLIAAIGAGELLGHEGTGEVEAGWAAPSGGGEPPEGGAAVTTGGAAGGSASGSSGGSSGGATGGSSGGSTGGSSGSGGVSTPEITSGGGQPGGTGSGGAGGPGASGPPSVFLPGVPLPGGSSGPAPEAFATFGTSTVPEPATLWLTCGGLAVLLLASIRRGTGGTR